MIQKIKTLSDKIYFKKETEFPIVIEDYNRKIEITKAGTIIYDKYDANNIGFAIDGSEPMLIKALEKLKEIRK